MHVEELHVSHIKISVKIIFQTQEFRLTFNFEKLCQFGILTLEDFVFKSEDFVSPIMNRMTCLNGTIDYDWLDLSFESYKVKCKALILD